MTAPGEGKIQKIDELESVRGIAAFLVVILHVPQWNPWLQLNFIRNSYLMVELFFVLSGFVIFTAYGNKIVSKLDLLRFQFLRFARLYPVHLLFLAVFLVIEVAKYFAQAKLGINSVQTKPFEENSVSALVQQLFLAQAVWPGGGAGTFNSPAWSISVEFYTYLIFGLIVLNLNRYKIFIFSVACVVSLWLIYVDKTFGYSGLLRCFAGFFLGNLTAFCLQKFKIRMPSFVSFLAFISIPIFLQLNHDKSNEVLIYFLTALLIFSLVSSEGGITKSFLRLKPITWFGKISYSMYMCHFGIIWAASQVIRVILKRPEVIIEGRSTAQLSGLETIISMAIILPIVIFCSYLVYTYVENPMRLRSRRVALPTGRAPLEIRPYAAGSAE